MRFAAEHGIHAPSSASTRRAPTSTSSGASTRRAVEAGAKEAVVVDTLGIASPEAVADLVGETRRVARAGRAGPLPRPQRLRRRHRVRRRRRPRGRAWVHGTINGMGERAGNANLCEVALDARALYGVETNLRLDRIRAVSARVREPCGYALEPGSRSSARPSSGARAARSRASSTTRRRSSRTRPSSSAPSAAIVLGKKSGLDSIRIKAEPARPRAARGRAAPSARRGQGARHARSALSSTDDEFVALVHQGTG